ncbi:cytochrome P450 [Xylaria intraflava]|nr:cytochrome P450 [Xylaria intraflava]
MSSTILSRGGLHWLPRRAALRYYLAIVAIIVSATGRLFPLYPGPLALLALYTFVILRPDHEYYVEASRRGCAPAPFFPRDVGGVRYLLKTARELKRNALLAYRNEQLETFGRTYRHGMFGSLSGSFTTDEPDNVRAILCTRFEDWAIPSVRIQGFLPVLGHHSIFTTNGPEWQHARAIMRPSFVRDQISDLACVDHHIRKLVSHIPKDGSPFDLQAMFSMMTTDSISDFMLGHSTDLLGNAPEDNYKFGKYFDTSMQKVALRTRLGRVSALWRDPELDECTSFMKNFISRFVKDARDRLDGNSDRKDDRTYVFLDQLLKSGEPDDVICDHLLSIFTAGRDTTTSVLTYLFLELSRRPAVVAAIREEIFSVGDDPSWEDLRNMRYLNWVLKEALRLNPPVATNQRQAVRDTVLPKGGGADGMLPVLVKAGATVQYIPWSMHRRKDVYGEDAEEFRPERWDKLRVTHEYLPFNAGPRICIGQQFALTQMALITFRLLQTFKAIEWRDSRPPVQKLGVNLSMLNGCIISVTPA